eukprot:Skav209301  [mRNA]  locus=scaffold994:141061:144673:+ [translate_table: standard]
MLLRAAGAVGISACLLGALDYAATSLRATATPSYPVPSSGGVLITGASTGIGLHAARGLAQRGFRVYAGVRNAKAAEEIRSQGKPGGAGEVVVPVILDVTVEQTVEEAFQSITQDLEREKLPLVGLVNCAGISRRLPLELEPLDVVKDLYEALLWNGASFTDMGAVNVFGVTRVVQRFLEPLRSAKGRIINVGSAARPIAALLPHKGSSSYSGSKAALEMITDTLRLELAPWEELRGNPWVISVSIIEPGYVQTPLAAKQLGDNAPWRQADAQKRRRGWVRVADAGLGGHQCL